MAGAAAAASAIGCLRDCPAFSYSDRGTPNANGGGGGNRTRVRKGLYEGVYTFSTLGFLSCRSTAERQTVGRPASGFHASVRGVTVALSRICVASSERLGRGYPGDVTVN